MAYPSSSNFPSQQQAQYPQSLQNTYQPDHYSQQEYTQQGQDPFSQPNIFSQSSFTQQQNAYTQDSFTQQLQNLSNQQSSYSQPSSSYSQPGPILQQRPSQTHLGQTPRQQFTQQASYNISTSQQPQQSFPQLSQNQYSRATSVVDQSSYTQQNTQQGPYPQQPQSQADRYDQRNSPVQPTLYNLQGQATQPVLHSQQSSLSQSSQFSTPGAQNQTNGFSQQTQQEQQHFSQVQSSSLNQQQNQQNNLDGQSLQARGPPFPPQSNSQMQRSQSLPFTPQSQQQAQQRLSTGDVAGTYQLFFTGRDDPRCCMLIGEDTKPVYLSFETQESNLNQTIRTMVYKNTRDLCAKLEWGTGAFLGHATIGDRRFPMAHLVVPGSLDNARRFASIDGKQFEWRRIRDDTTAYDLYMAPDIRIALFRKYNQLTPIGPSHGLIQYTFSDDALLIEALLALLLNRWMDMNGM